MPFTEVFRVISVGLKRLGERDRGQRQRIPDAVHVYKLANPGLPLNHAR